MDINYIICNGQLYHHGVKGMKWGVRRYQNKDGSLTKAGKYARRTLRGHAGPGINIGSVDRRLAKAQNDLEYLKKGGHLSVGSTKERQAQYDKRDRDALEKTVSELIKKKAEKRSERFKDVLASRDPISKKRREQAKEREKRQSEKNEILQAKGKDKVHKILKKIGKDLINPVVMDGPTGPKRQPWDEKPDYNYRGGRI